MAKPTTAQHAPQVIPFPRQPQPKVDFPFIMVPDAVAADRQLSQGAKILFGVILTYARRGHCYAGNETLAARAGLSKVQVCRLLAVLAGRGLIVRDLRGKVREEIRVPMLTIKTTQALHQNDASSCILGRKNDSSNGCTGIESQESEDSGLSLPPEEEIDPWTRRWFGAPPTDTIVTS